MGRNPRNKEYTKEYNRKMLVRLLRIAPMSRADLARELGLTRAATSLIAEDLLLEGLIEETTAKGTQIGRTPVPLKLRNDAGYAVGVYLNRDGCTAGITSMNGELLTETRLHLTGSSRSKKLLPLSEAIQFMIEQANIPHDKIVGIGISAPGPLDGESGRILNPPRFDLWHNTDICTFLSAQLHLPVYLENNASCLARYNLGKPEAKGSKDFLLLLVDSGIGSGIISNRKILKGAGYFTSELGHTSINYRGRPCECGNIGCLEAYATIPNLLKNSKYSSWKELIDHLSEDDAQGLIKQEADYLAAGIITATNMVSIDTVLLAGDLLYGIHAIVPLLEERVNSRILRRDTLPIRILPSCAGADVPVQAAANVAFERFLMV